MPDPIPPAPTPEPEPSPAPAPVPDPRWWTVRLSLPKFWRFIPAGSAPILLAAVALSPFYLDLAARNGIHAPASVGCSRPVPPGPPKPPPKPPGPPGPPDPAPAPPTPPAPVVTGHLFVSYVLPADPTPTQAAIRTLDSLRFGLANLDTSFRSYLDTEDDLARLNLAARVREVKSPCAFVQSADGRVLATLQDPSGIAILEAVQKLRGK